uniref:Bulb-type lectin domain-containing protein n=1 Tax=Gouania willdenowi TaxID=441366 RepID=A0A8C5I169_GOUWI
MSRNYLSKNDELRRGDYIMANNREFKAIFQNDGNFVVYGWQPLWHTDTVGDDSFRVCLQADCDLVMYSKDGNRMWHSATASDKGMCRLHLTDDGKMLLHREEKLIWNSAESKGKK